MCFLRVRDKSVSFLSFFCHSLGYVVTSAKSMHANVQCKFVAKPSVTRGSGGLLALAEGVGDSAARRRWKIPRIG